MRIISGKLKSYRFQPPKGFPSRPTTDFAKEALFNVLENRISLIDLEILDLFSGTGNISFEFASRNAGKITAVDSNFKSVRFINEMTVKYKIDDVVTAIKNDAVKFVLKTAKTYDIIFADPPFDKPVHQDVINAVFEKDCLKKEGILIIEHSKRTQLSEHPQHRETRKYGNVCFSFFSKDNE